MCKSVSFRRERVCGALNNNDNAWQEQLLKPIFRWDLSRGDLSANEAMARFNATVSPSE